MSDKLKKTKYKNALIASIGVFAMSSMSFLLIPISYFGGIKVQRFLAYMVGVLFWTGLIIGLIITFILGKVRKKANYQKYAMPGVICFFKNKKGKICDIVMIFSVALFIFIRLFFSNYILLWIIMLTISIFSTYMHSILNGNNYSFAVQKEVK